MAEKKVILIADDVPEVRATLARFLEKQAEVEIHEASDGVQALDMARRTRPDVIVLDLEMPGLNGFDVCTQLRASDFGEKIVIIILTGQYTEEIQKEYGLAIGADLYIIKPFDAKKTAALILQLADSGRNQQTLDILNKRTKRPLSPFEIDKLSQELM